MRLCLLAVALSALSVTAHASAIFIGPAQSNGGGIGTSNVILTLQNTGSEQGCVAWNGTADVIGSAACPSGLSPAITGGDEKTGSSQTQTRTITQTGVTSALNLIMLLNVNEPAGDPFTVSQLSLTIYAPDGTILFNSGNLFAPTTQSVSFQGQGNPGFAFKLDAAQAAFAQPFWANPNNRFGIAGLITGAAGSNETWSVADASAFTFPAPEPNPVPEPSSISLSLIGFSGVALAAWRKRRA